MPTKLSDLKILIRGAGEMATGCAIKLQNSGFFRILMTDLEAPLAVRRTVSFCEAVWTNTWTVEGITAERVDRSESVQDLWRKRVIPVMVDPDAACRAWLRPDIIIDALLAKKNTGVKMQDAPLVIGLGPGFCAGSEVHYVVETNRGHNLGRLISKGYASPNTGVPGDIAGQSTLRVIRAPADGTFRSDLSIGTAVTKGQVIGDVSDKPIRAAIDGILRGLIRPGSYVTGNLKIGDIDPRGKAEYAVTISEKARAIGGAVLEAALRTYNK